MPPILTQLARYAGLSRLAPIAAPEAKTSAAAPLIALQYQRQPVWSPRDYSAFSREGFMQNPVVYRCVRMIAEAAASIPFDLFEGETLLTEHPLLDLLTTPNPLQARPDLMESWYSFLLVSGNAYMEAVAPTGTLRELYVLRPDRISIVPGASGWPASYDYTVNGNTVSYSADALPGVRPVLHQALFHPTNDYYGLSPIEAAATAIDIHNSASAWNKAMLDNSALPSGALVYTAADRQLTAEQYARLKSELESTFQGAKNAGRPMLLEGGLDWRAMSLSPKDMDFTESKRQAARDIALALGVPPMLLGIPGDNTHANYQEANRAFWRHTVLPLTGRTLKALSGWLGPAYGGGLELRMDLDGIEALSAERDQLWSRVGAASFLTDDEKRAAVGYGVAGVEGKLFNPGQARA
jgi:HK97 family phage portal protein